MDMWLYNVHVTIVCDRRKPLLELKWTTVEGLGLASMQTL